MGIPAQLDSKLKIRCIARTGITDEELREAIESSPSYIGDHLDAEFVVEFAGRSCYQSWSNPASRSTEGYISNIIGLEHFSVLEHPSVTFYLEGISRSLTHELIRHRHFSYSQLSQRYVDQSDLEFIPPPLVRNDPSIYAEWIRMVEITRANYIRLEKIINARHNVSRKQVREAVRSVLASNIETKITVTGNLRSWLEFLPKRMSPYADAEFQEVASELFRQLKSFYPSTFKVIESANL